MSTTTAPTITAANISSSVKSESPASPTRNTVIQMNTRRSKQLIKEKIRLRVQERETMLVNGVASSAQSLQGWDALRMVCAELLPEYLAFRPPSQESLDRDFPVHAMDWNRIQHPPNDGKSMQITWLGHSTLLVQLDETHAILTDPVFSDRCSPFQWIGPKRYRPPPCSLPQLLQHLPPTSSLTVLISHNHYDHMDYNTIQQLVTSSQRDETPGTTIQFVVPLGIQEWFHAQGFFPNMYELDWHETALIDHHHDDDPSSSSLSITSLPMRHWSNRTGDRDATLWCGYSIVAHRRSTPQQQQRFLFPGDTAWFDGLHDVGRQYGPWHVAALPIGAYAPRNFMRVNHVDVPEAVRMKDTLRAYAAVPVHWGTFPLTVEPVLEPREWLVELMREREDQERFVPWCIGDTRTFPTVDVHEREE